MKWPQIVMIVMYAINIACELVMDGEPKEGTHNFLGCLIGSLVGIFILYKGGFWG